MSEMPIERQRQEPLLVREVQSDTKRGVGPITKWYNESAWHGMGLFGESFLLFSVGTLKPFWAALYPDCIETHEDCSIRLTSSLTSSAVLGIIIGMIVIGTMANSLGRRKGSILTASIMSLSALLLYFCALSFSGQGDSKTLFTCMSILLFAFGVGVGGEYPLSAVSANERALAVLQTRMNSVKEEGDVGGDGTIRIESSRGKKVLLVFTMQGMGIFLNSLLITTLLLVTKQTGSYGDVNLNDNNGGVSGTYSSSSLRFIWHFVYALASLILVYVTISRYMHLEESEVWLNDRHNRSMNNYNVHVTEIESQQGLNRSHYPLLFKNYWHRIFGASLSWLVWDIAFYGNKLFQSSFLMSIAGDGHTLLQVSSASTINAFIALMGYFAAAYIIDRSDVGRLRLQMWGFAVVGSLYIVCSIIPSGNTMLVFIYFLSSFFSQCGPNATTFLIPTEIFPTEMRTMCHGIAAASGKLGALIAAIYFNYTDEMFLICGYCCLLGCVISFIFIPETTTMDLFEVDKRWRLIASGHKNLYHGPAVSAENSSFYERKKLAREVYH